ncbi:hypothetical protein DB30_03832 [Enhygromyxa salina]|uniref:Lipoprotein n=1 Tax=Enhygromyxa salina TaxID=215803 RepID=A0A0C2D835_9BACT|nr:hypothetical protein [Enhygromyxa salina]KIG19276.1 hypothetical protein DB30_03832 [Enhygromyxa salina]
MDGNRNNKNTLSCIMYAGLALAIAGCGTEADINTVDSVDNVIAAVPGDEVHDTDMFRGWIGYTSEEYPSLMCPNHYAVRGFDCDGSYCDNVSPYCEEVGGTQIGSSYWTDYFSEEGSGYENEGHCWGSNEWMTGVDCTGSYCDNLSLRCTAFPGSKTGNCYWSGWYSEEQSAFMAGNGYYIKGMECNGSYCDNKRYRYCRFY